MKGMKDMGSVNWKVERGLSVICEDIHRLAPSKKKVERGQSVNCEFQDLFNVYTIKG